MTSPPLRVLFLCTFNSARSQMAEALLRHLSQGRIHAFSAGSTPQLHVHPMAVSTLQTRYGIDAASLAPKSLDAFVGGAFDYVFTLCDLAAESCPVFPGAPTVTHWSFEDPAAIADDDARRRAFEAVADDLAGRLRLWLADAEVRQRMEG